MSEYDIPNRIVEALQRYVDDRIPTGHFLRAVLENNLTESLQRADDECLLRLKDIIGYCYNELPSPCWGSKKQVSIWLKGK